MVSEPVPSTPTTRLTVLVQVEPAPVMVTLPAEPDRLPTHPRLLLTLPPASTVSVPVPALPTYNSFVLVQVEPVRLTATVPTPLASLPM